MIRNVVQEAKICKTNSSMSYQMVLNFAYDEFISDLKHMTNFIDALAQLGNYPALNLSLKAKLSFFQFKKIAPGSVSITGNVNYPSQQILQKAGKNIQKWAQGQRNLGGFSVESVQINTKPSSNQTQPLNNTNQQNNTNPPNKISPSDGGNNIQNKSEQVAITEEEQSSNMAVFIGAGVGGGVLIVILSVVIYRCKKQKQALRNETGNAKYKNATKEKSKAEDPGSREQNKKDSEIESLGSSQFLPHYDQRLSMDPFGDNYRENLHIDNF